MTSVFLCAVEILGASLAAVFVGCLKRRFGELMHCLRDGGLIVTDGSLGNIRGTRKFHNNHLMSSQEAFQASKTFVKWGLRVAAGRMVSAKIWSNLNLEGEPTMIDNPVIGASIP